MRTNTRKTPDPIDAAIRHAIQCRPINMMNLCKLRPEILALIHAGTPLLVAAETVALKYTEAV